MVIGVERRAWSKHLFLASLALSFIVGLVEHTQNLPAAFASTGLLGCLWGLHIYHYRAAVMALLAALACLLALWIKVERRLVRPIYALGLWLIYLSVWATSYFLGRVMDGEGWLPTNHPLCGVLGYLTWPTTIPIPFLLGPLLLLFARWLDLELSRKAYVAII